ncbi:MAG: HAD-IA family hydrolase [Gammaproteobacteria bacterium]|nr:HAD-IA family hydrolase [Gammaproteobacteria bacterium]MCY4218747.1 HAD-IA family hydrolase [Gammaproteobacteria bacterium]MCY4275143.1 HAD-IA family hydrolase [Gammaproteobacteria bacterium]
MFKAPDHDFVVVCDLAGVLVEWSIERLYGPLCQKSGRRPEQLVNHILGPSTQAKISMGAPIPPLLEQLKSQYPEWKEEISAYWTRWDEMLVGVISGSVSVLEELKERGHRLYVLGNWGRGEFERARPRMPFLEIFNDVLLSGDCGFIKPDPAIFAMAEQQFHLVPEKTVFIDDRKENVLAAIDRGWDGIVFENPRQLYLTLMDNGML